ncbi:hypothetical protein [Brachyspira sp.]|uniref:hypothetical protein n=1 Tax=Brachyspira sp. TaxID=1977261 RepID=UPI003D7EED1E
MSKKYIVEKGKAISTKEGVINENQEVKEELLNGNAEALLKAGIIREIDADKKAESKEKKDKDEDKNKEDDKANEDDKDKSNDSDKKDEKKRRG